MIETPEVEEAADKVRARLNPAPREWTSLGERLDETMRNRLSELFGGY